jgi:mitosis inhibitor protein kinase SWE1
VTGEGRFKIGDFGMASLWPRPRPRVDGGGFEREGDKLYLAPEVLQGEYGKAADIFRSVRDFPTVIVCLVFSCQAVLVLA